MPIIRKDFLAVFAVQMELESNGKKKNLRSQVNPETIQFAEPQAGRNLMVGGYLKSQASKGFLSLISIPETSSPCSSGSPNKVGN